MNLKLNSYLDSENHHRCIPGDIRKSNLERRWCIRHYCDRYCCLSHIHLYLYRKQNFEQKMLMQEEHDPINAVIALWIWKIREFFIRENIFLSRRRIIKSTKLRNKSGQLIKKWWQLKNIFNEKGKKCSVYFIYKFEFEFMACSWIDVNLYVRRLSYHSIDERRCKVNMYVYCYIQLTGTFYTISFKSVNAVALKCFRSIDTYSMRTAVI